MTNLQIIKKLQKIVKKNPSEFQAVSDLFEMLRIYENENYNKAHGFNKDLRGDSHGHPVAGPQHTELADGAPEIFHQPEGIFVCVHVSSCGILEA